MDQRRTLAAEYELLLGSTPPGIMARLCRMSRTHFRELIKSGIITRKGDRFDAFTVLDEYISHLKGRNADVGEVINISKELELERHRKLKLENDKTDGYLIPVDDVTAMTDVMTASFTQGLESLPGRLANVLAGENEPAVIRKVLQDETRRIRQTVSVSFEIMANTQTLVMDGEASTGEDAGSVG